MCKSTNSGTKYGDGFLPSLPRKSTLLRPFLASREKRMLWFSHSLQDTHSFSRSWGNMSNWFQRGKDSELSCSYKCPGVGGGTIIPGSSNLCFWKKKPWKELPVALSSMPHCPTTTLASRHNPGVGNSLFPDLLQRPRPLCTTTCHIFTNLVLQPYCWNQITQELMDLFHFPHKRLRTNIYWPTMCQAEGWG